MTTRRALSFTTAISLALTPFPGKAQNPETPAPTPGAEAAPTTTASSAATGASSGAAAGTAAGAAAGAAAGGGSVVLALGGLALAGGLAAAAMGGGGDDGGDDGGTPNPNPDPVPEPEPAPRASFETQEYSRNWGLDAINAAARYADGGTGQGVLLAVFDSGADVGNSDLAANIDDSLSHTYYQTPDDDTSNVFDDNGHGTHMAHVIAGVKNGSGGHGVAFNSDLMILQGLDHKGSRRMTFLDSFADGTDRAVDAGARAINHSWTFIDNSGERTERIDTFQNRSQLEGYLGFNAMNALTRAVDNDLVMVFSTGNDGFDQPSNTAGMAVLFPEMGDHVLGVTAIDSDDRIADFANRCGIAMNHCLAAPGASIFGALPGGNAGYLNGTSSAAAHVTGAVGVLASNFPELTGAEITTILRDTAHDLGAKGVDEVYGHGALDLQNAVMPQGDITIQTTSVLNEREIAVGESHVAAPGAMAGALASTFKQASLMVTDGYDRGYSAPLDLFVGSGFDEAQARGRMEDFTMDRGHVSQASAQNSTLALSLSSGGALPDDPYAQFFEDASSMAMSTDFGATRITVASAFTGRDSNMDGNYMSLGAAHDLGGITLETRFGQVRESNSFLGTQVSGAFGGFDSQTTFASLGGKLDLGAGSALSAMATMGETSFDGSNLLRAGKGLGTQSIRLGYEARDFASTGDSFEFAVSREMSLTGGDMTVALPTALGASKGNARSSDVTVKTQSLAMDRAAAPVDLEMRYTLPIAKGRFAVGANWRPQVSGHGILSAGYTASF